MSLDHCDFYCDESNTNGGGPFYLGAIYCSPQRAEILRAKLKEVRKKHLYGQELKWTKLTHTNKLPIYFDFADVFLDDTFARFVLMRVERGAVWRDWAPTESERFFKTYYVFLRMNMNRYVRYNICLDNVSGKLHRWDKLKHAINNAAFRDKDLLKEQVRSLQAMNSESNDLLQLTDLILGGATSGAMAEAKVKLAQHIRLRLQPSTLRKKPKFTAYDWTPRLREFKH